MATRVDEDVIIVGAGPAGLAVAAALRQIGVGFTLLDRTPEAGGLWNLRTPGTPCHAGVIAVTPSTTMAFSGVSLDGTNGYSSQRDVEEHLQRFLTTKVRSDVRQFSVDRVDQFNDGWRLTSKTQDFLTCRSLVLCTGLFWEPRLPANYAGACEDVHHVSEFGRLDPLDHGIVRIVGAGNSAADAAITSASAGLSVCFDWRAAPWVLPPASEWAAETESCNPDDADEPGPSSGMEFQQAALRAAQINSRRLLPFTTKKPVGLPILNSTVTGNRLLQLINSSADLHVRSESCCAPNRTILATGYSGVTTPLGSLADLGLVFPFLQSVRYQNLYSASHFLTERAGFPLFEAVAQAIAGLIEGNQVAGTEYASLLSSLPAVDTDLTRGLLLPAGNWIGAYSPALTYQLTTRP